MSSRGRCKHFEETNQFKWDHRLGGTFSTNNISELMAKRRKRDEETSNYIDCNLVKHQMHNFILNRGFSRERVLWKTFAREASVKISEFIWVSSISHEARKLYWCAISYPIGNRRCSSSAWYMQGWILDGHPNGLNIRFWISASQDKNVLKSQASSWERIFLFFGYELHALQHVDREMSIYSNLCIQRYAMAQLGEGIIQPMIIILLHCKIYTDLIMKICCRSMSIYYHASVLVLVVCQYLRYKDTSQNQRVKKS